MWMSCQQVITRECCRFSFMLPFPAAPVSVFCTAAPSSASVDVAGPHHKPDGGAGHKAGASAGHEADGGAGQALLHK